MIVKPSGDVPILWFIARGDRQIESIATVVSRLKVIRISVIATVRLG